MTTLQVTLIDGVLISAADTPQLMFTSPDSASPNNGLGTLVSALNIANSSGSSVTYKLWIVPGGSSVADDFILIPERQLKTKDTDVPYEVASQLMPANAKLYIECNTSNVLSVRGSGVNISTTAT